METTNCTGSLIGDNGLCYDDCCLAHAAEGRTPAEMPLNLNASKVCNLVAYHGAARLQDWSDGFESKAVA